MATLDYAHFCASVPTAKLLQKIAVTKRNNHFFSLITKKKQYLLILEKNRQLLKFLYDVTAEIGGHMGHVVIVSQGHHFRVLTIQLSGER